LAPIFILSPNPGLQRIENISVWKRLGLTGLGYLCFYLVIFIDYLKKERDYNLIDSP
jgi:hypothetical protein